MSSVTGKTTWAIPEGYIPEGSTGPKPEMESHETVCVLNATEDEASLEISIYFADRDPIGPFSRSVPPKRTRHFRFKEFDDPERIPRGVDYASVIESDVPIICQHTRLDTRQAENALLTTIAHPGDL